MQDLAVAFGLRADAGEKDGLAGVGHRHHFRELALGPLVVVVVLLLELLRLGTQNRTAVFRDGQEEAIRHIVDGRGRLLVVQRTGWGKSFVYFIAAKLLREQSRGPAILISPLLALMRNQIAAAERMGV